MKNKLLLSLGLSVLVFAPVMTVVACGKSMPVGPTDKQKADEAIAKVTTDTLGEITMAGSTPSNEELTAAIKAKNIELDSTVTFEIQGTATETGATVKAKVGLNLSASSKNVIYVKANATTAADQLTLAEAYFANVPELDVTVTDSTAASTALLALIIVKHASYDYTIQSMDFANKTFKIKVTNKTNATDTATSASNKTFTTNALDIVNLKAIVTGEGKLGTAGAWTSTMNEEEWNGIAEVTTETPLTQSIITSTWLVAGKTMPTSIELDGAMIEYTLAKSTDTITITVKLAKGEASDTIVYTIAKPDAPVFTQEDLNTYVNTTITHTGLTGDAAKIATLSAFVTTSVTSLTTEIATALGLNLGTKPNGVTLTYTFTKGTETSGSPVDFTLTIIGTYPELTDVSRDPITIASSDTYIDYTAANAEADKITVLDLGVVLVATSATPPDIDELTIAIKNKNYGFDEGTTFVLVGVTTSTSATVKASIDGVQSEDAHDKTLTFTVKTIEELNKDEVDDVIAEINTNWISPQAIRFRNNVEVTAELLRSNTMLIRMIDPLVPGSMEWTVTNVNTTDLSFTIRVSFENASATSKIFNYTITTTATEEEVHTEADRLHIIGDIQITGEFTNETELEVAIRNNETMNLNPAYTYDIVFEGPIGTTGTFTITASKDGETSYSVTINYTIIAPTP